MYFGVVYSTTLHAYLKVPNFAINSKFCTSNMSVLKIWFFCHLISPSSFIKSFSKISVTVTGVESTSKSNSASWSLTYCKFAHQALHELARTRNPLKLRPEFVFAIAFPHSEPVLHLIPWLLMTPHSLSPSIRKTQFHYFPRQSSWSQSLRPLHCHWKHILILFALSHVDSWCLSSGSPDLQMGWLVVFLPLPRRTFLFLLLHFTSIVLLLCLTKFLSSCKTHFKCYLFHEVSLVSSFPNKKQPLLPLKSFVIFSQQLVHSSVYNGNGSLFFFFL